MPGSLPSIEEDNSTSDEPEIDPDNPRLATRQRPAVLLVDADPAVRRILSLVLNDAGWDTVAVEDAETALGLVEDVRPAVVLAEARLPGMDGGDLLQHVRQLESCHPGVVLMSAYPRPRNAVVDEFIPKPLRFDRLLRILEEVRAAG